MGSGEAGRNRLGDEKSPYLLQHRDNPVWWQPWGQAAFDEAARRNVPVFLSIGYSTCHWCHVMEHESFEDAEVARVLNEGFVAVKVDREERPDVDAIYMDAVQATTGRGGWPMSVFLQHDGRPFFAGTYFPRDHFLHLLAQIERAWREQRADIESAGHEIANALATAVRRERAGDLDASLLRQFVDQFAASFDTRHGGRRGAPKFPAAYDLQLLLRVHRRSGDARALEMAQRTLDAMAAGGIYDHLGGGFHRYATDERWLVPHFEKMLYDQASLAGAYLDGWLATGRAEYERVVRETLDYVLRDLTAPEGGFWCAEDADSEGEEGRFYVWTPDELDRLLPPNEAAAVREAFGVAPGGNFEHGTSILELQPGHARTTRPPALERAMAALFAARSARVRPHLDDKVLADWNGLMIASMARAGRALGEPRYVDGARRAARFVLERMRGDDGRLLHRYRDGQAAVPSFLDDHAFLVHGLIELYQATFDPEVLAAAENLQSAQDALFWDAARSDYFATDGRDRTVIVRRADFWDNVTPAGRSVAAYNLLRLSALCGKSEHGDRASRIFASTPAEIRRAPTVFAFLLAALDFALDRAKEIAIVGPRERPDTQALLAALAGAYLPNVVIACGDGYGGGRRDGDGDGNREGSGEGSGEGSRAGGETYPALLEGRSMAGGKATAYVCEHGVCRLPTADPVEVLAAAGEYARLG